MLLSSINPCSRPSWPAVVLDPSQEDLHPTIRECLLRVERVDERRHHPTKYHLQSHERLAAVVDVSSIRVKFQLHALTKLGPTIGPVFPLCIYHKSNRNHSCWSIYYSASVDDNNFPSVSQDTELELAKTSVKTKGHPLRANTS